MAAVIGGGRNRLGQKCHTVSLDICQHNDSITLVNL